MVRSSFMSAACGVLLLPITIGILQAQESHTLRYGYEPGDVYHYRIEMRWTRTDAESRDQVTLRGLETQVVSARDVDTITILPLVSGLRFTELALAGLELDAMGDTLRGEEGPFFGPSVSLEPSGGVPANLHLGKVSARFSDIGIVRDEAMFSRFWSVLIPIGDWVYHFAPMVAVPWTSLPAEAARVGSTWDYTLTGAPDTFRYELAESRESSGIACELLRGSLDIDPELSAEWEAPDGTEIRTELCLATAGGYPVTEEVRVEQSLGEFGQNEQLLQTVLVARGRLDAEALRVVRGAADSTFPALQRVPDEVVSDLLDEPAPELELTDQVGTSRRLSDFAGRVAAVHFWTPWSGVSTQTLVGLLDLDADFPPEDVVVLPVIAEDEASRRLGIAALVLQEMDSSVAAYRPNLAHLAAFHADAVVPVTLIIDREGIVRKAFLGYTGRERLKASIREVLEGT